MAIINGTANADRLVGGAANDVINNDPIAGTIGSALNDSVYGNGGNDILNGGDGNDTLNGGIGDDTLNGGAGIDTADYSNGTTTTTNTGVLLAYTGAVGGVTVNLSLGAAPQNTIGAGTDTLIGIENVTGTAFIDTLTGDGNDNVLSGLAGNDTLNGGSGNDRLDGGTGADTMNGGFGNDTYVVDSLTDVVNDPDFPILGGGVLSGGIDTVESSITYTLGATLENLTLTGAAAINGTGNARNNVITGNGANNILSGLAGNDTINGGFGNDRLDGGTGADTMNGGFGNDTYVVDNVGDVVNDPDFPILGGGVLSGGIDTVESSITYTLGATLENLTLTGVAAINGTGNAGNNTITGNSANNILSGLAGNDILSGGSGNDRLDGGTGADTMNGGFGNDTYVVDNGGDIIIEPEMEFGLNGGTDLVESSITYTLNTFLEHLTLTGAAAVNGTGNAGANVITGNVANNVLSGLDGDDTLNGGAGNDTLNGGNGNDRLNGGTGADTMNGGFGNDTYVVDNVGDVVSDPDLPILGGGVISGGIDTVESSITYTLGATLENLTLTGVAAINGTGNARNNIINGNLANNVLSGLDGNDTLNGGFGNDTLNGGNGDDNLNGGFGDDSLNGNVGNDTLNGNEGNDTLRGGLGNDTLNGGAGIDTASYSDVFAGVTVNLANGAAQFTGGAGTDTLVLGTIENLTGSNFSDTLIGDANANVLSGLAGNDQLNGGGGTDTLIGGAGSDTLTGGAGFDIFDYNAASESGVGAGIRDVITDFSGGGVAGGDVIDLTGMDANTTVGAPGDQAFTYIGAAAFGAVAGQLRFSGGLLQGDTDGNGTADFEISLLGVASLTVGDDILV